MILKTILILTIFVGSFLVVNRMPLAIPFEPIDQSAFYVGGPCAVDWHNGDISEQIDVVEKLMPSSGGKIIILWMPVPYILTKTIFIAPGVSIKGTGARDLPSGEGQKP